MLSYQHMYHAGNLADVHKHALLAWTIDYLTAKDKPLSYLETHAGRGLYQLDSDPALKTGEARGGIERVMAESWFRSDHPYMQRLQDVREGYGDATYPGSPLLAGLGLRTGDKLHLAELHPQEFEALDYVMSSFDAHCHARDGFATMMALTPPVPRRGMLLIDPSYEVKTDYTAIPDFIAKIHRKWNVGIIMLWYPILKSNLHAKMLNKLESLGLGGAMRHEVRFDPIREGHGMIGSGVFVVNAPYGLQEEAQRLGTVMQANSLAQG